MLFEHRKIAMYIYPSMNKYIESYIYNKIMQNSTTSIISTHTLKKYIDDKVWTKTNDKTVSFQLRRIVLSLTIMRSTKAYHFNWDAMFCP